MIVLIKAYNAQDFGVDARRANERRRRVLVYVTDERVSNNEAAKSKDKYYGLVAQVVRAHA